MYCVPALTAKGPSASQQPTGNSNSHKLHGKSKSFKAQQAKKSPKQKDTPQAGTEMPSTKYEMLSLELLLGVC